MTDFFYAFQDWLTRWQAPLALPAALLVADQLRRVPRGERALAASLFAGFFLVILAFWILKPVKKALFLTHYARHPLSLWGLDLGPPQVEMLAKEANVLVALGAALLVAALAGRLRREAYLLAIALSLAAALVALAPALAQPGAAAVWAFYLLGDLFVTTLAAGLFSLLADSFDPAGGRRAYAFVGLGGVLGGLAGTAAAGRHAALADPGGAALAAFALTLVLAAAALAAGFLLRRKPPLEFRASVRDRPAAGPLAAIRVVSASPYLRLIFCLVLLYELVSVSIDFQFTSTVTRKLAPGEYRSYFSAVFAFTNFMAVAVQLLLTGWLLRRFGAGPALLLMPVAVAGATLAFFASPVLLWASLASSADNALAYSVQQTAKEFLYLPTSRTEKYQGKGLIDVFGMRLAKGLAVLLGAALSLLLGAAAVRWLSPLVLALIGLWVVAAWRLRTLNRGILASYAHRGGIPT